MRVYRLARERTADSSAIDRIFRLLIAMGCGMRIETEKRTGGGATSGMLVSKHRIDTFLLLKFFVLFSPTEIGAIKGLAVENQGSTQSA